jgi:hypothetical protein
MADAFVILRLKEKRNVYADIAPASGTETIVSVTVTLYDSSGAVAGAVSATPIVQGTNGGWTVAASADPQAWYRMDPTTLGISAGYYSLAFVITDSASPVNVFECVVGIRVQNDYA